MVKLVISSSRYQSQVCDLLPCNFSSKSQLIHSMLEAYDVFKHFDKVIKIPYASKGSIEKFHSKDYLAIALHPSLNRASEEGSDFANLIQLALKYHDLHGSCFEDKGWSRSRTELYKKYLCYSHSTHIEYNEGAAEVKKEVLEKFGLVDDCPFIDFLPVYIHTIAGATLSLADEIYCNDEPTLAINWDGGRHHAMKSKAAGFCYVNDIVLLIQLLRRKGFSKISYIDFDLHHGDGVENAFAYSKNVQTCSLHLFEPGFFPGTGSFKNCKENNIVNIPLLHGLDDATLINIVQEILLPQVINHDPNVLVIQCGGDGLGGDKYDEWQLSIQGFTKVILTVVMKFRLRKIILVGGGGYNPKLQSRFYNYLTIKLLNHYKGIPLTIFTDEDELIRNHDLIELYEKENYRYWHYEYEGINRKTLINNNNQAYISRLKGLFNITGMN